jgi:hypothetical protein
MGIIMTCHISWVGGRAYDNVKDLAAAKALVLEIFPHAVFSCLENCTRAYHSNEDAVNDCEFGALAIAAIYESDRS